MAESVIERCTERVDNRFKLVLLASQRTHDLNTGASNPVEVTKFKGHKNTIISLCEIAERQVDTHELFSLLVSRCKEYMKENVSSVYNSNTGRLESVLNFSDDRFNVGSSLDQESVNIHDNEFDTEVDGRDGKEVDEEVDSEE